MFNVGQGYDVGGMAFHLDSAQFIMQSWNESNFLTLNRSKTQSLDFTLVMGTVENPVKLLGK